MKRFLAALIFLLCLSTQAWAAYTKLAGWTCAVDDGTHTATNNVTLDTTGADLIVLVTGFFGTSVTTFTIVDSNSNIWNQVVAKEVACADMCARSNSRIYATTPTTVGSSNTFHVTTSEAFGTYPTICVAAFSGSSGTPTDQTNSAGNDTLTTSLSGGSVTPAEANELVVAGWASLCTGCGSAPSSFTASPLTVEVSSLAQIAYLVVADQIQSSATTVNPSWSWTTAHPPAATIATFKASGGGGGGGGLVGGVSRRRIQ